MSDREELALSVFSVLVPPVGGIEEKPLARARTPGLDAEAGA
jgi:hypothetical protein